jgi:hypothetical protein
MNVFHFIYNNSEGWPAVNAVFQKSENIFAGVRYAAIPMQAVAEASMPRPTGLPPAPDFVSHIGDGGFEVVCGFDCEFAEGNRMPDSVHSGLGPLVNIFIARDEELLADEGGEDFDSWVAHCKYDNGERGASVNTNLKNNENILGVRFLVHRYVTTAKPKPSKNMNAIRRASPAVTKGSQGLGAKGLSPRGSLRPRAS